MELDYYWLLMTTFDSIVSDYFTSAKTNRQHYRFTIIWAIQVTWRQSQTFGRSFSIFHQRLISLYTKYQNYKGIRYPSDFRCGFSYNGTCLSRFDLSMWGYILVYLFEVIEDVMEATVMIILAHILMWSWYRSWWLSWMLLA